MPHYDPDDLRSVLRVHMEINGLNVNSWAKLAEMPESTLRNFLAGRSETITYSTLVSLAKAIKQNVIGLLVPGTEEAEPVHVLHESNADKWSDHMFADHEARFWLSLPKDPRYPSVLRVGVLVGDDSFDQFYLPGAILVCAAYEDIKRTPRSGDRVLCIEQKASLDSIENDLSYPDLERTSVREIHQDGDDIWLMLRSARPNRQQHIKLAEPLSAAKNLETPTAETVDGTYVGLEGVVIGSYQIE